MLLANIFLLISLVISLLLGLLSIVSNPRKSVNRALAALTLGIALWILANFLTNLSRSPSLALFFARTTLIGAAAIPYLFVVFAKNFTLGNKVKRKQLLQAAILPLALIATFPTRLNIVSVSTFGQHTKTGVIYFLLTPMLVGYFSWGLAVLITHYRRTSNYVERAQLRYVFTGAILAITPTVLTNAILPILGVNDAVLYGPNAVVFLVIFTSIAIVKHQLLDIRLVVARTLTYVLSLVSLAVIFASLTFGVTNFLLANDSLNSNIVRGVYTALAIVLAFVFPPLKRFFDRLTSRIFYQDAYDAQELFDHLNRALVSTLDIVKLSRETTWLIADSMKAEFCYIGLHDANNRLRIIGSDRKIVESGQLEKLTPLTPLLASSVIATDYLDDSQRELKRILVANDIAVLARLSNVQAGEEIGYLILGTKKSGNVYSSKDLRVLDTISNELIIAMQNALRFEEIQNFNATLQQKVQEATHKLQNANKRLTDLDETKDDFISMASHQLRTPLTSVKGYLSLVLEGDAGKISPLQRKMLSQAFTSSQHMVYLIADLLNVSRLKTGKFIIDSAESNLAEVVQEEINQLTEVLDSHSLKLVYNKPTNFPELMLDETKTRQVIMNFIDNAIYYTPAGGVVTVELLDKPQDVELRVVDNGIGVPKSEQHHLFTKFYRAGNARKARPDGTGLGLFMAKKVVIAQGGAIIFESTEGKGSVFGFSIPKSKIAMPTLTPAPEPERGAATNTHVAATKTKTTRKAKLAKV
jgi:signal transduction histidine kinase